MRSAIGGGCLTVAELKAFLPADTAVVYIDGIELMPEDVETDQDGDFQMISPEPDDDEEADDEAEDEAE